MIKKVFICFCAIIAMQTLVSCGGGTLSTVVGSRAYKEAVKKSRTTEVNDNANPDMRAK